MRVFTASRQKHTINAPGSACVCLPALIFCVFACNSLCGRFLLP